MYIDAYTHSQTSDSAVEEWSLPVPVSVNNVVWLRIMQCSYMAQTRKKEEKYMRCWLLVLLRNETHIAKQIVTLSPCSIFSY